METTSVARRTYPRRKGVDWFDPASGQPPRHDQKHVATGKYWNAFLGTWCSKKSRKAQDPPIGQLTRLSWSDIPRTLSPGHIGMVRAERIQVFLTLLYRLQYIRHGHGHRRVLYVDNQTLRVFLGHKWPEEVDRLVAEGLVRHRHAPSRYDARKRCLYLCLADGLRPDADAAGTLTLPMEYATLERSIKRYYGRRAEAGDPLLDNIHTTLKEAAFEPPGPGTPSADPAGTAGAPAPARGWLEFLSGLSCCRNEAERRFLFGLVRSPFTDRIDHAFTPLPRAWQSGIRLFGERTVRVGIRNSLAGLLSIRFSASVRLGTDAKIVLPPTSFLSRLSIANQAGMEIFDYMALRLDGRESLKLPGKFEEMRTLFLRMLFGPPKGTFGGREVGGLIRQVFGEDMVVFLQELREGWKGKPDSFFHKNLSTMLQREEAGLLQAAMTELVRAKIPFLPMHDALMVLERHEEAGRHALIREITRRGWGGTLKV